MNPVAEPQRRDVTATLSEEPTRHRRGRRGELGSQARSEGPVPVWVGPAPVGSNPGVRVARHRATTAHLASVHPFHGGHALAEVSAPFVGVNRTDGGSAWCYDPFELYGRDLGGGTILTNSNMLVLGFE